MFIKSLRIGLIGFVLCAANAWAGPSSIQGVVKDAKGQAIKARMFESSREMASSVFNTVKTDAKGRYISRGAEAGRLPSFAGSEWRSESVHYEHETQGRSNNATEL